MALPDIHYLPGRMHTVQATCMWNLSRTYAHSSGYMYVEPGQDVCTQFRLHVCGTCQDVCTQFRLHVCGTCQDVCTQFRLHVCGTCPGRMHTVQATCMWNLARTYAHSSGYMYVEPVRMYAHSSGYMYVELARTYAHSSGYMYVEPVQDVCTQFRLHVCGTWPGRMHTVQATCMWNLARTYAHSSGYMYVEPGQDVCTQFRLHVCGTWPGRMHTVQATYMWNLARTYAHSSGYMYVEPGQGVCTQFRLHVCGTCPGRMHTVQATCMWNLPGRMHTVQATCMWNLARTYAHSSGYMYVEPGQGVCTQFRLHVCGTWPGLNANGVNPHRLVMYKITYSISLEVYVLVKMSYEINSLAPGILEWNSG